MNTSIYNKNEKHDYNIKNEKLSIKKNKKKTRIIFKLTKPTYRYGYLFYFSFFYSSFNWIN